MSDIALLWNDAAFGADMALAASALSTDDGLKTAIIISLFTDARAQDGDPLPDGADPRGWWGNGFAPGDLPTDRELGSRLWLLARAKTTADVPAKAREYALEALQWMLDDGVAASVEVTVERQANAGTPVLAFAVAIKRPGESAASQYDLVWEASA